MQASANATQGYILGNGAVLLSQLRYCSDNRSLGSALATTYTQEAAFFAYCPIPGMALGVVYVLPFPQSQTSRDVLHSRDVCRDIFLSGYGIVRKPRDEVGGFQG